MYGQATEVVEESDAEFENESVEESNDASAQDDVLVLDEAPDPDSVLPVWEPTGNATVDSALEKLDSLADVDVSEHAATFERIEQSLRATLNGLAAEDESV